ncbi:MAG: HAD hydrolase family protein, partial [Oscillospiraceae bacterium]|nr:HAD hydrolase family protein [Oscillospiraceae bacterium]
FSGEIWRRFASKKAENAFALEKISERLCISAENIAAFGDDFNDVEMLKYCGTGVAMGNAVEEAKQAADFVCDTNDNDGLAKFIEENFLE